MNNTQTAECPLVTFALFAYNQEQYVREAIEGAFAQTYQPLEIILSDDCSTDRTFEIMQEMAGEYKGPHRVRAQRTKENCGTLAHLLLVSRLCQSDFMIVAAGDDVSHPERVTELTQVWLRKSVSIVQSDFQSMNAQSKLDPAVRKIPPIVRDLYFPKSVTRKRIFGATSAYEVSFLHKFAPPKAKVLIEDIVFELTAATLGLEIASIDKPLVFHREHPGNLSQRNVLNNRKLTIKEKEISYAIKCSHYLDSLIFVNQFLDRLSQSDVLYPIDLKKMHKAMARLRFIANWWKLNWPKRIWCLFSHPSISNFRWAAPRFLGISVYAFLWRLRVGDPTV